MEKLNYGTAYTAFSRVSEDKDWCLAEAIPFERLEYLYRHSKKKLRENGEKRLAKLSETFVKKNMCSKSDYLDLIREIDFFCNDGIQDAHCSKSYKDWSCVYHTQNWSDPK